MYVLTIFLPFRLISFLRSHVFDAIVLFYPEFTLHVICFAIVPISRERMNWPSLLSRYRTTIERRAQSTVQIPLRGCTVGVRCMYVRARLYINSDSLHNRSILLS